MEVVIIIITWVEVEEVEVTVEQVEQEEERGEAQILNIKCDTNSKYEILESLGPDFNLEAFWAYGRRPLSPFEVLRPCHLHHHNPSIIIITIVTIIV